MRWWGLNSGHGVWGWRHAERFKSAEWGEWTRLSDSQDWHMDDGTTGDGTRGVRMRMPRLGKLSGSQLS